MNRAPKRPIPIELEDDTPAPKRARSTGEDAGLTELQGPTGFTRAIYGDSVVDAAANEGITPRKILEEGLAYQQCLAVIGNYEFGVTPCWICGFRIRDEPGLKPECEHVLPVAQGAFLLSLYTPRADKDVETEMWKIEYAWAHLVCNRVKSASHFLKPGKERRYEIDIPELDSFLLKLESIDEDKYGGGGHQLGKIIKGFNRRAIEAGDTNRDPWLVKRRKAIADRITKAISRFPRGEENLALLGYTAALMNPESLSGVIPDPPAEPIRFAKSAASPAMLSDEVATKIAKRAMWFWFQRWIEEGLQEFHENRTVTFSDISKILPGLVVTETSYKPWVMRKTVGTALDQYKYAYSRGHGEAADAVLVEVAMYSLAKVLYANIRKAYPTIEKHVKDMSSIDELIRVIRQEIIAINELLEARISAGQIKPKVGGRKTRRHSHTTTRRRTKTDSFAPTSYIPPE